MTVPASQRLSFRPRWGRLLMICPIGPALWTRCQEMSIAWTYSGDISISTCFLDIFLLSAVQREQMAWTARLNQIMRTNREEIGYAE